MISSKLLRKTQIVNHAFFNSNNGYSKGIYIDPFKNLHLKCASKLVALSKLNLNNFATGKDILMKLYLTMLNCQMIPF